jgi:hypothetical protein
MQLDAPGKMSFLARKAYFVVRRPRLDRDKANVLQEYSDGWSQYRAHLAQARTLDDWLRIRGVEDQPDYYNVDGALSYEAFDSAGYYRRMLLDALRRYFPQARSVTEFGAGVGRNVLFLKREAPDWDTYGYELCTPGVEVAQAAAEKFHLEARYAQLDYLNDPPAKYVFPVTDVAYTMFSLEQLPRENQLAVRNMLDHVRLGTLHIEPVPENYPYTLRGLLGRVDHWKVDYLSGFDRAVRGLALQQVIVERLASAHNPLMFPSLYVLKKQQS